MNNFNADLGKWLQTEMIFHGLSPSQLPHILQIAQLQTWQKDELIFKQNSPATVFLWLKRV